MIDHLYQCFLSSTGVSTDTRTIEKDNIWFALKGPNFNANKFAEQALDKGARFAVIDDESYNVDDRCIVVEDVLQSLQRLATHHRRHFDIPFIGITGSNGKTTTKELVRDVLSIKFKVHATKGNLNNHIGVPLTLLEIKEGIEIAIIEMGANAQKEIGQLCSIAEPTHGLITNIGKAHLEGFGGLEGVFKGKTEMYDYLSKVPSSTIFVNSSNEMLLEKARNSSENVVTYFGQQDDFSAQLIEEQPQIQFEVNGQEVSSSMSGRYNFENICTALCLGEFFGVELGQAKKAIEQYESDNNRSQLIDAGTNKVLLDAYNANPTSMALALENFARLEGDQKIAIIGDMLELGEDAEKEHHDIGELTKSLDFQEVHLVGPLMKFAAMANPEANYWEKKPELETYLKEHKIYSSFVLLKGSRGIGLETLLDCLK